MNLWLAATKWWRHFTMASYHRRHHSLVYVCNTHLIAFPDRRNYNCVNIPGMPDAANAHSIRVSLSLSLSENVRRHSLGLTRACAPYNSPIMRPQPPHQAPGKWLQCISEFYAVVQRSLVVQAPLREQMRVRYAKNAASERERERVFAIIIKIGNQELFPSLISVWRLAVKIYALLIYLHEVPHRNTCAWRTRARARIKYHTSYRRRCCVVSPHPHRARVLCRHTSREPSQTLYSHFNVEPERIKRSVKQCLR